MQVADARPSSTERPSLIVGSKLRCPHCEVAQDVLAFHTFGRVEKYAHELSPVHKCRLCGHYFAPVAPLDDEVVDVD